MYYGLEVKAYEQNRDIFKILSSNISSFAKAALYNDFVTSQTQVIREGEKVGLIKIDVEGNEPSIVYGLERFLRRGQVEALIIEISPKFQPVQEWLDLINFLKSCGYEAYDIGLSPRRELTSETNHLEKLVVFNSTKLYDISQTNLLFLQS